jgi:hypothetical protein
VVLGDQGPGGRLVAVLLSETSNLVVEDIRQTLQEDQGQDVVLELRGIQRPPDYASGVPEPLLQRGLNRAGNLGGSRV